ncbi:hypothetical protein GGP91_003122 [Salinibacter ruber]|nr:hypothetical protein [Salinibacter ruber]MCS4184951.1 hypothetical protein [Salinibacter ruber]MCS4191311.1 hypothetical protein [Salinibacter ruber]
MDQTGRPLPRSASTTTVGLGAFLVTASLMIASAAGLQGCSQTKESATSRPDGGSEQVSFESRLPACWELQVAAEGPRRDSLRSWLPEGRLPSVIELDTTLAESAGSDSVYKARSRGGYASRSPTTWRYSKGDSIRVERGGAMAGMMLQLKPTGDKLIGSVVAFTDTRGIGDGPSSNGTSMKMDAPRKRGPIEAIPVECKRQ